MQPKPFFGFYLTSGQACLSCQHYFIWIFWVTGRKYQGKKALGSELQETWKNKTEEKKEKKSGKRFTDGESAQTARHEGLKQSFLGAPSVASKHAVGSYQSAAEPSVAWAVDPQNVGGIYHPLCSSNYPAHQGSSWLL